MTNDAEKRHRVEIFCVKKILKLNTYKKYRKDAQSFLNGSRVRIRDYALPAAQQTFEKKACAVLEAYAKCGDLKHSKIREILMFVEKFRRYKRNKTPVYTPLYREIYQNSSISAKKFQ